VNFTLIRTKFFDQYLSRLNERQLKAVNKMLDASFDGFKGGMTAKKYISINRISKATATRDLQELVGMGILLTVGAGRSVHYDIKL
jgi:Fic family protein